MDKLPDELLAEVLRRLPPHDRLDSALTCHRWAQAVSMPPALKDVLITIRNPDMENIRAVLIKSHRQYQNFRFSRVDLSFDPEFWEHVGKNIRELELYGCRYAPRVFYKILLTCTRLESLRITNFDSRERTNTRHSLPDDISLQMVQASLRNMRRLHLSKCVTAEMLAHLLRAMPNVTSISFSSHYCTYDFVSKLSDLSGTSRLITSLDLNGSISEGNVISLLRLAAPNLQELQLPSWHVNRDVYEALSGCTKLRRLKLQSQSVSGVQLKKLLSNNPDLETLELRTDGPYSDEKLAPLRGLRKLRELSFHFLEDIIYFPYITNEFLCSLGEMSTLQCLKLDGRINDVRVVRSIANLPNLHTLQVTCLDPQCFDVIIKNFKNLSALEIGDCYYLSNEDFAKLRHLNQLKSLRLHMGAFTDRALEKGLGPRSLESLTLICGDLSDAALASIAAHHDRLERLGFHTCRMITTRGIVNLLRGEPLLRKLYLRGDDLNDDYLEELEHLCPRLRVLSIPSDSRSSVVERLKARRPMIRVVWD